MPGNSQDSLWTPRLELCKQAIDAGLLSVLVRARLLELALGSDGKIAVEACKLLVGGVSGGESVVAPELANLPLEILQDANERAVNYLLSLAGANSTGDSEQSSSAPGSSVLAALRPTNYAIVPNSEASSSDNGSVGTGGTGEN